MYLDPTYLIMGGLVIVYLLWQIHLLKNKVKKPDYIYIDKSGISANPSKNYIDVRLNKTINFKLYKEDIHINHFYWMDGIKYIQKLSILWRNLSNVINDESTTEQKTLENTILYATHYNAIVSIIYELSAPHAKSKRRLKKELWKKSREDVAFIIGVCNEVLDYWRGLGKLIALLGQGETARSTAGERYTWKTFDVDKQGNLSIKPRYGNYTNSPMNSIMKPSLN